jgi:type II secretory pathway component PulF
MSFFRYRAYNAAGKLVTGSIEADSLLTVESRLKNSGIWLLDAQEASGTVEKTNVNRVKVKRSELIGFFVQMNLLLRSGITIPNALDRLAKDSEGTKLGVVVESLQQSVAVGVPLHQAMAAFPRCFPAQTVAIVQAGEISGKLPEVFESLSAYYEWLDHLVSEIRQALIYPLMVMGASAALVLLLFTFVVPRFVGLLTELALEIPMITRIVMGISNTLLAGWPVILAGIAVGVVGLKLLLRSGRYAAAIDKAMMHLPIFGPLIAMFALSRFTHNLGMLYKAGIPLLRGLEICRGLVGNRAIEKAIEAVRVGVSEGTPLSKGLAQHDVFPPTLVTMIATGETSGTLDFALQSVSDYYNKIIPRRIKMVFAVFDPLIMLSLIGVVGFVALAVILPILQLWNAR